MRPKFLIVGAASVLILVLCIASVWLVSRSRTFQVFGELTYRVDTSEKLVALTFDDGPTQIGVDAVLPVLQERGIRATFFLVGGALEKNLPLGARIAADGHEIGNHTYTHQRMVLKSPSFIRREIERTDQLIRESGYSGPIHFRPPYGKKLIALPWYLSRTGRRTIMWDVEPESYPEVAVSADRILAYTVAKASPGSIIILHPMARSGAETREALPEIIDALLREGYRFVTVSDLLSRQSPAQALQRISQP